MSGVLLEIENLKGLDLKANKISELPPWTKKLVYQRFLQLSNNRIPKFDLGNIIDMKYLSDLDVSNNKIIECFSDVALYQSSLISDNLSMLRQINVSKNFIQDIPKCVIHLENLTSFNISYNQLTSFDSQFIEGFLPHLDTVDISNNKIVTFPKNLYRWLKLSWISIENNEVRNFPVEIGFCYNLNYFNIAGNPTILLKNSSMRKGVSSIQNYLREKAPNSEELDKEINQIRMDGDNTRKGPKKENKYENPEIFEDPFKNNNSMLKQKTDTNLVKNKEKEVTEDQAESKYVFEGIDESQNNSKNEKREKEFYYKQELLKQIEEDKLRKSQMGTDKRYDNDPFKHNNSALKPKHNTSFAQNNKKEVTEDQTESKYIFNRIDESQKNVKTEKQQKEITNQQELLKQMDDDKLRKSQMGADWGNNDPFKRNFKRVYESADDNDFFKFSDQKQKKPAREKTPPKREKGIFGEETPPKRQRGARHENVVADFSDKKPQPIYQTAENPFKTDIEYCKNRIAQIELEIQNNLSMNRQKRMGYNKETAQLKSRQNAMLKQN